MLAKVEAIAAATARLLLSLGFLIYWSLHSGIEDRMICKHGWQIRLCSRFASASFAFGFVQQFVVTGVAEELA
jgi:hypothetical protein